MLELLWLTWLYNPLVLNNMNEMNKLYSKTIQLSFLFQQYIISRCRFFSSCAYIIRFTHVFFFLHLIKFCNQIVYLQMNSSTQKVPLVSDKKLNTLI